MRSSLLLFSSVLALTSAPSMAAAEQAETKKARHRPLVHITKGFERVRDVPGSVHIITKDTIETYARTDINDTLRTVPGVNVQDEDGLGLRPNIGLRGGRVNRSADITLMEDGVLIAPAPYSAPDAYLFPYMEHVEGVEVRKGASAIKYGPRTTNGAVNLLSTSIPDYFSGQVKAGYGSYNQQRAGVQFGDSSEHFGYVIDSNYGRHDGFKKIDGSSTSTGVDIKDNLVKLRLNSRKDAEVYQEIEFKNVLNEQRGNETYMGLTMDDFRQDPLRRYAASELDTFEASQRIFQLRHYVEPTENFNVTSNLYRHHFHRDWSRVGSVNDGTSNQSITSILNNPSTYANHLAILKGGNSANDAISYTSQDRQMDVYGFQTEGVYSYNALGGKHELAVGARVHKDNESRIHTTDGYAMQNGKLVRTSMGAAGNAGNRVASAVAYSAFAQQEMKYGDLTLVPGVRYEHVRLKREDYGNSDINRTGANLNVVSGSVNAVTPGVGATYDLSKNLTVLAGVHKGFAPPGVPSNAAAAAALKPEKSLAYEAGARYNQGFFNAELIGFYTDYENLLGRDTFSSGGGGTGDLYNGGQVSVRGVEAVASYDLSALTGQSVYRFPVRANYTFTDATFGSSFNSSFGEWGNVSKGDALPYIPKHQFALTGGVEHDEWLVNLTARYTDQMRTSAGKGALTEANSTDANWVLDAAAEYEFIPHTRVFVTANNLLDEVYVAAARPSGVRPGEPMSVFAGVKHEF